VAKGGLGGGTLTDGRGGYDTKLPTPLSKKARKSSIARPEGKPETPLVITPKVNFVKGGGTDSIKVLRVVPAQETGGLGPAPGVGRAREKKRTVMQLATVRPSRGWGTSLFFPKRKKITGGVGNKVVGGISGLKEG